MQPDILAAGALTLLISAIAGRALTNSIVQLCRVRTEVASRRVRYAPATLDPFAILTDRELETLAVPTQDSRVPGTKVPDPRQEDLDVSDQRAAIYANVLRDRAAATSVAIDLLVIVVSILLGVALPDLIGQVAAGGNVTGQVWGVGALLATAGISIGFKLRIVPLWESAAECYWALADKKPILRAPY